MTVHCADCKFWEHNGKDDLSPPWHGVVDHYSRAKWGLCRKMETGGMVPFPDSLALANGEIRHKPHCFVNTHADFGCVMGEAGERDPVIGGRPEADPTEV